MPVFFKIVDSRQSCFTYWRQQNFFFQNQNLERKRQTSNSITIKLHNVKKFCSSSWLRNFHDNFSLVTSISPVPSVYFSYIVLQGQNGLNFTLFFPLRLQLSHHNCNILAGALHNRTKKVKTQTATNGSNHLLHEIKKGICKIYWSVVANN